MQTPHPTLLFSWKLSKQKTKRIGITPDKWVENRIELSKIREGGPNWGDQMDGMLAADGEFLRLWVLFISRPRFSLCAFAGEYAPYRTTWDGQKEQISTLWGT